MSAVEDSSVGAPQAQEEGIRTELSTVEVVEELAEEPPVSLLVAQRSNLGCTINVTGYLFRSRRLRVYCILDPPTVPDVIEL